MTVINTLISLLLIHLKARIIAIRSQNLIATIDEQIKLYNKDYTHKSLNWVSDELGKQDKF